MPVEPLPSQRHRFDIPDGMAYLNCAYLSPLMDTVLEAGRDGLIRKQHPWTILRGDFHDPVEAARQRFAALIGAAADDVAVVASTSYGVATAARNLAFEPGQNVVLLADEHASNTYAWVLKARAEAAELRVVARPADGDWTSVVLEQIDARTALAALPTVHWTDGARLDLVAIGERCRAMDAALVVDGTQSIGAVPFDVRAVQPVWLCCSAYKWLMCPYSLAFLYAAPAAQAGTPLEQHEFVRAGTRDREGDTGWHFEFQPGARRYDMGERSNFVSLPMAIAALDQLLAWTPAAVAATTAPLVERIADLGAERGLGAPSGSHRSPHLIGLAIDGTLPDDVCRRLSAAGVEVSRRGSRLRISPHVYNHMADVDRLFAAIDAQI